MRENEEESEKQAKTKKISAKAYEDALILMRALEVMLEKADALGQGPEDERVRCLLDRHNQLAQSLMAVEILPPENDGETVKAKTEAEGTPEPEAVRSAESAFESPRALYQSFYQVYGHKLAQNEAQMLFDYAQAFSQNSQTKPPAFLSSLLKQNGLNPTELFNALQDHKKWSVFRELSGVYASPRHVFEAIKERCHLELSKAQANALYHFFDNGTFDGQSLAEPADFQRLSRLLEQIRPQLSKQPQLLVERLK